MVLGLLGCGTPPGTTVLEPISGCGVKRTQEWDNAGVEAFPRLPICPLNIKVGGFNPNVRLLADTYDYDRLLQGRGYWAQLIVKTGTGAMLNIWTEMFTTLPIGQPNGMEAVRFDVDYSPAIAGYFPPTVKSDTGTVTVMVNPSTPTAANASIVLEYQPEGKATVMGPSRVMWGEPVEFHADADTVRRPAGVVWRFDGVVQQSGTIGWGTKRHSFQPGIGAAGSHTVVAEVTSATGRVTTITRTLIVDTPPECEGGGGGPIPFRAAPGAEHADSAIAVPLVPRATSCPPT
jgi:hypothetical protein